MPGRTFARPGLRAPKPAGAGVRRRDERESRRQAGDAIHASNAHPSVFERLTERFESRPGKLRELVEKQDAAMGKAHLSRSRAATSSHHRDRRDRVMRGSERRRGEKPSVIQKAGYRVDAGDLEGLFEGERWENRGKPRGKQALPRPGRAHEKQIVPTCGGDLEGALRLTLAFDVP